MGFPYSVGDWSAVDGAMFMGWGTIMPMFYTLIAMIVCIAILVVGDMIEKDHYEKLKK